MFLLDPLHLLLHLLSLITMLSYFLIEDEVVIVVMVMIQGVAVVMVVETQVAVEGLVNVITAACRITHLHAAGRSTKN